MEDLIHTLGEVLVLINSADWAWKFAKWFWKWLQPEQQKSYKKKRTKKRK